MFSQLARLRYRTLLLLVFWLPLTLILRSQTTVDTVRYNRLSEEINGLLSQRLYQKAIDSSRKLVEIATATNTNLVHAEALNYLLYSLDRLSLCDEGERIGVRGISLLQNSPDSLHIVHVQLLNNLGALYENCDRFSDAVESYHRGLHLDTLADRMGVDLHHKLYNNLSKACIGLGDFEAALRAAKRSLEVLRKYHSDSHPDFASRLNITALQFKRMGQMDSALVYYEKAIQNARQFKSDEDPFIGLIHSNISGLYSEMEEFERAKESIMISIANAESNYGAKSNRYYGRVSKLANIYEDQGDYAKALTYYHDVLDYHLTHNPGTDHLGRVYNNLGLLYGELGQFQKALSYLRQALTLTKKVFGRQHLYTGSQFNSLASVEVNAGLVDSAIAHYHEAIQIEKQVRGEKHWMLGLYYSNISSSFHEVGNYHSGIEYGHLAREQLGGILGEDHADYAFALNNLGLNYFELDSLSLAEQCFHEAASIVERSRGLNHSSSINFNQNLALCLDQRGQLQAAAQIYHSLTDRIGHQVDWYYPALSDHGRIKYWNVVGSVLDKIFEFSARNKEARPDLVERAYDLHLKTKNLSLAYGVRKLDLLRDQSDPTLISLVAELDQRREIYYNSLGTQSDLSRQAQREEIHAAEGKLLRYSSISSIDLWSRSQIMASLDTETIAVDFFQCKNPRSELNPGVSYYAFVLDYENLQIVPIANEAEILLLAQSIRSPESSEAELRSLSNVIFHWLPEKAEKVLINPVGYLHQIPFQALSVIDPKREFVTYSQFGDLADLYLDQGSASLFGDPDFDLARVFDLDSILNPEDEEPTLAYHIRGIDDKTRSSIYFNALPGTGTEIDQIEGSLGKANWTIHKYRSEDATEESFKQLDGEGSAIIHMATHGFFFPRADQSSYQPERLREHIMLSGDPWLRSGLVLAGVNSSWLGQSPRSLFEDGVLTAFEIAALDLSNTQLVVLSACQTGLGDLDSREGVLGLQRAFRMAGVEKLLVSLWKVPDESTSQLMSIFYEGLSKNMTIRDAFARAQKEMSTNHTPYHWAGFVLIE